MEITNLKQAEFLEKYHLQDIYKNSDCNWDVLNDIYLDYTQNKYENFQNMSQELLKRLDKKKSFQSALLN